jgi:hypothetical protein
MSNGPFWCSECGVEIKDGDICNECDSENGASHMTYTFIVDEPEQSEPEPERPWWKIW